jgi:hypothetical protein
MSDTYQGEPWGLCRTVLKERDTARAELDTLRLLAIELMRECDQAWALAHDCYEALRRGAREESRTHRDRWEELEQLGDRLRNAGWRSEAPAIDGLADREGRCPKCGLRLVGGGACLLCSAAPGNRE